MAHFLAVGFPEWQWEFWGRAVGSGNFILKAGSVMYYIPIAHTHTHFHTKLNMATPLPRKFAVNQKQSHLRSLPTVTTKKYVLACILEAERDTVVERVKNCLSLSLRIDGSVTKLIKFTLWPR